MHNFLPDKVVDILKKYGYIILIFSIMIFYVLYVYFVFYLETDRKMQKLIKLDSDKFINLLLVVAFGVIMLAWSHYKSVTCTLNFVKNDKIIQDNGEMLFEFQEKNIELNCSGKENIGQNDKFCLICQILKPVRAHHCRICNRCVYMMDHHCFWINNCVGFYNKKPFVLILFWGTFSLGIASIFSIQIIIQLFTNLYNEAFQEKINWQLLFQKYLSFAICVSPIPNFFSLGGFFLNHLQYVSDNLSLLDVLRNDEVAKFRIYDKGYFKNLQMIFGVNPIFWLFPIGKQVGEGDQFNISENSKIYQNQNILQDNNDIEIFDKNIFQ